MSPLRRIALAVLAASTSLAAQSAPAGSSFADLTALFAEWRTFQRPVLAAGVPDYTDGAMARQSRALAGYQKRLNAIAHGAWPVDQQVDWYIVRAEMNGLAFDHRVLRPWANNPAFYVTVFADRSDQPAREGPLSVGAVELWRYTYPLSASDAARMDLEIKVIPALLAQARKNLTGKGRDLWLYGAKAIREQSATLAALAPHIAGTAGTLPADVQRAKEASDVFAAWLDAELPKKTAASGVGVRDYEWYLTHVQLVPFTYQDEVTLMRTELARSWALLALEETKNAGLPAQVPIASAEEHSQRFNAAVTDYMAYLSSHQLMTIAPYMDSALRSQIGSFTPGPREFFTEVDYRDPEVMRTHGYHWFDLGRMENDPNPDPIRRGALLYNMFNTRTEGFATAWEELMLNAGMFDARPRSRELIYILVAERAARALGDLGMVNNSFTLEQASTFASENTPRGWLSLKMGLVRGEQHLYLQQPGYGTSYLIGKMQMEMALAARMKKEGDAFSMKRFMDDVNAAGLIPASLLRWQLTGEMPADVKRMLDGP
jgi:hypothetical protein